MLEDGKRYCDVCGEIIPTGSTHTTTHLPLAAAAMLMEQFERTLDPAWITTFAKNADGTIGLEACVDCHFSMGAWATKLTLAAGGLRVPPTRRSPDRWDVQERAIAHVLQYERSHGREPQDVHPLRLPWDVESCEAGGGRLLRRIEVKAEGGWGLIQLTEKQKDELASRPDEYWIYWVGNLASDRRPKLAIIPGTDLGLRFQLEPTTEYRVRPIDPASSDVWLDLSWDPDADVWS